MTYLPQISIGVQTETDYFQVESYAEYSLSINGGSTDYVNAPDPGHTSVTLFFDDDTIPAISIGDRMDIYESTSNTLIFQGVVANRSTRFASVGIVGYIAEWTYELVGVISTLQKTMWYNPATYTGRTDDAIDYIMQQAGHSTWSTVPATLQWGQVDPYATWEYYDYSLAQSGSVSRQGSSALNVTIASGWRNAWEDLVTLTYGAWGYITEWAGSSAMVYLEPPTDTWLNFTYPDILTNISASDGMTTMRNDITVQTNAGVSYQYQDQNSIRKYSGQPGTLTTFINNQADTLTVATKILNGLAYPYFSVSEISLEIILQDDPYFMDKIFDSAAIYQVLIEPPPQMGYSGQFLVVGYNININKNSWLITYTVVPYTVAVNSINWDQIDYSYTWTSYGVAYPTQKWSDL